VSHGALRVNEATLDPRFADECWLAHMYRKLTQASNLLAARFEYNGAV
jgi:hypothetical protein